MGRDWRFGKIWVLYKEFEGFQFWIEYYTELYNGINSRLDQYQGQKFIWSSYSEITWTGLSKSIGLNPIESN